MVVIQIETKPAFVEALRNAGNKLVVVDFTAVWCGPCQRISPVFKKLSEKEDYKDVVFLKVDVDEAEEVSSYCEIKCMPTFQFYKNGEKVHEFSGANEDMLVQNISEYK